MPNLPITYTAWSEDDLDNPRDNPNVTLAYVVGRKLPYVIRRKTADGWQECSID